MLAAADTSSLVAYLSGESGADTDLLDELFKAGTIMIPPVVIAEILSDPRLPPELIKFLAKLPVLQIIPDYWERAGRLRSELIRKKLKARLGDALIAQSCIDHDLPLITRDNDFRHFTKNGRLKVLLPPTTA